MTDDETDIQSGLGTPHATASGRAEMQTPFLSSPSARPSLSVDPPHPDPDLFTASPGLGRNMPGPRGHQLRLWLQGALHDSVAGDFTGWVHPSAACPHCVLPELGNHVALLAHELLQGPAGADSSLSPACPWHCPARAWHAVAFRRQQVFMKHRSYAGLCGGEPWAPRSWG